VRRRLVRRDAKPVVNRLDSHAARKGDFHAVTVTGAGSARLMKIHRFLREVPAPAEDPRTPRPSLEHRLLMQLHQVMQMNHPGRGERMNTVPGDRKEVPK
jgi:hypothetical protein